VRPLSCARCCLLAAETTSRAQQQQDAAVDVHELLRDVVTPVLDQVLQPGELDAVRFDPPVTGAWPPSVPVLLQVTAVSETCHSWAWTPGQVEETPTELGARLAGELQDVIAESRFGWAEQRPYVEPS
jgi:hypothetical protein